VLLIRVGPEQADERIASMESTGSCDTKVGEEGNALRLGKQRMQLSSVCPVKI